MTITMRHNEYNLILIYLINVCVYFIYVSGSNRDKRECLLRIYVLYLWFTYYCLYSSSWKICFICNFSFATGQYFLWKQPVRYETPDLKMKSTALLYLLTRDRSQKCQKQQRNISWTLKTCVRQKVTNA